MNAQPAVVEPWHPAWQGATTSRSAGTPCDRKGQRTATEQLLFTYLQQIMARAGNARFRMRKGRMHVLPTHMLMAGWHLPLLVLLTQGVGVGEAPHVEEHLRLHGQHSTARQEPEGQRRLAAGCSEEQLMFVHLAADTTCFRWCRCCSLLRPLTRLGCC